MTTATSSLAFRRRGESAWTEVDPGSSLAQRLLGLSHPVEEDMSAATLHVVPANASQSEKFGWLLTIRRKAREAYDYAVSLPGAAWNWARETLHLDGAWAMIKDAGGWLAAKASGLLQLIGLSGGTGLGLLAMTTDVGRSILSNTLGRAWGWLKSATSWLLSSTLSILDHLGSPGRWVADRLVDIENLTKSAATKVLNFYAKHIAKHLAYDGKIMQSGKIAGVWLVVLRALGFITPAPVRFLLIGATSLWTLLSNPVDQIPGIRQAAAWIKSEPRTRTHMKAVDAEFKEAVAEASAAAATAPAPPTPANRASKRAAARRR